MTTEDDPTARSRRAWHAFCDELQAVGDRVVDADETLDERAVAEGYRFLTRLARMGLELHLEYGDPAHPRLVNHERPSMQWGGPNPDNYYLRAAVDPAYEYRVWGDVTGVEEAIFSLMEGDMALGQYGVFNEMSLSDLEIRDGRIDFTIAADDGDGDRMPMHPAATNLTIRIYQSDPSIDAAPYLHIERLGATSTAEPAMDVDRLESGLDAAMDWIAGSATFWKRYTEGFAASPLRNVLSPPTSPPGGADNILYGGGMWRLAPDEVLLVECDVPDARYWNLAIHTRPWLESGDLEQRRTSCNHRETFIDRDGRFRVVVAHADPGVPNWIDTEGRTEALLTYRWIWSNDAPHPTTRVTTPDRLRALLPADHPVVTADARRSLMSRRAELLRERYR